MEYFLSYINYDFIVLFEGKTIYKELLLVFSDDLYNINVINIIICNSSLKKYKIIKYCEAYFF